MTYHFQMCPRYVLDMSWICPNYVPDMSQKCPRYAPDISNIYPRYVLGMSQMFHRYVTDMSQICPPHTVGIPLEVSPWRKMRCMGHLQYLARILSTFINALSGPHWLSRANNRSIQPNKGIKRQNLPFLCIN